MSTLFPWGINSCVEVLVCSVHLSRMHDAEFRFDGPVFWHVLVIMPQVHDSAVHMSAR